MPTPEGPKEEQPKSKAEMLADLKNMQNDLKKTVDKQAVATLKKERADLVKKLKEENAEDQLTKEEKDELKLITDAINTENQKTEGTFAQMTEKLTDAVDKIGFENIVKLLEFLEKMAQASGKPSMLNTLLSLAAESDTVQGKFVQKKVKEKLGVDLQPEQQLTILKELRSQAKSIDASKSTFLSHVEKTLGRCKTVEDIVKTGKETAAETLKEKQTTQPATQPAVKPATPEVVPLPKTDEKKQ